MSFCYNIYDIHCASIFIHLVACLTDGVQVDIVVVVIVVVDIVVDVGDGIEDQ